MRERGLQVDHTTIYRLPCSALLQSSKSAVDLTSKPPLTPGGWMKPPSKSKKPGPISTEPSTRKAIPWNFSSVPREMLRPLNASRVKALRSSASSAPQGCPVQEQVEEPTALADPTPTTSAPRVINVEKNAAYPKAIAALKAAGTLPERVELRQVKYLNNLVEQDHRFIKRLVKPGMGFFSFETAGRTLQGYEVMHMLRKGQVRGVGKADITGQVTFIASLFGVAA
jgi:transposase, IS6 family